ncbi:hypothetical protein ATANTOWER_016727 [Ataeniobius toweri]|uniref:Uncharacterized protein n=1 Tax=Ataeniobius toweri TaxID=208326 RepID=A0ABU7AFL5_9TELE|nr:hypothetical protein [Ataeniobius toweri]
MHVVVFNMGNTTYYPGQHSLWSGTRTLEQSESQLLIPGLLLRNFLGFQIVLMATVLKMRMNFREMEI